MLEALRCPGCGSALPADAPEGLCPGCLLNQALQGGSGSGGGPGTTTPHSPGIAFVPPSPEDLAPLFPQLEVIERLGQGGMGVVYKARQVRLDRPVALKILPPELGRDPAFAERFAREARALARLTHPRIVGVHDFGESGGLFYLLMEFVDGVNLRGLLRRGRLMPEEALRIIPQVCEALQYAHEEGVVHRDIKPENILLDRRGNVKIADFGLAKLLGVMTPDSALTGSRQVIGTLRYMAPEQMERPLGVDHRADIYSLGVVFYEMLTGELPLGRFDPPSKKAEVDVRLDEVILRALEKEPERRYQHASEVKTEVESLSIPPGYPETRSGLGLGRAGSRPVVQRREAWLLLPLLCAAFIATLVVSLPPTGMQGMNLVGRLLVPPIIVLVAGAGLWGLWRFVGGGRAGDMIDLDRGKGQPVGTPGRGQQAWLLVPICCAAFIAHTLSRYRRPDAGFLYETPGPMVLALGVGLWALWQFVRAGRARDINSQDGTRRPHARAAGIERQVWLLVPIFCGAFIVHAGTLYHSPLAGPPWYHRWDAGFLYETPGALVLAVGVGLWALWQFVLAGRVERFDGHGGSGGHRPRAAGMGRQAWLLITIACAAFIVHAGTLYRAPDAGPFYETPGPMVLALGIGLWALWQFFRGGRAEDVKTTLPEIDPPRSSLDRDFEGS